MILVLRVFMLLMSIVLTIALAVSAYRCKSQRYPALAMAVWAVNSTAFRAAVIIDAVKATLDETPPELVADLMEYGIVLAGGGALLHGLAQRLQDETRMHVYVADNPLTAVVMGTGMILEKPEFYQETLTNMQRKSTIR